MFFPAGRGPLSIQTQRHGGGGVTRHTCAFISVCTCVWMIFSSLQLIMEGGGRRRMLFFGLCSFFPQLWEQQDKSNVLYYSFLKDIKRVGLFSDLILSSAPQGQFSSSWRSRARRVREDVFTPELEKIILFILFYFNCSSFKQICS